jgi:transcriptional regulator with XRE-family HTH domain
MAIFGFVPTDYLHKIDIKKLSRELHLSLDEIAALVGIRESRNLGKWAQSKPDGVRPKYNSLIKLLQAGASVETLFGVEYKTASSSTVENSKDQLTPNDLSWAFGEAMKLLQEKKDKEQK